MNFDYKSLGSNIKKRRKEKKLTQAELAEVVDVSDSHIGRIENGRSKPSVETLAAIANALATGIDNLAYGSLHNKADYIVASWIEKVNQMAPNDKTLAIDLYKSMLDVLIKHQQ